MSKKTISFIIDGEPMCKQRPKFSKVGNFVKTYTPKETVQYESRVLIEYKEALKEDYPGIKYQYLFDKDEPIYATIVANFGLTKRDYGKKGLNKSGKEKLENKWCQIKKDCDNIAKIILDALNGIAYYDDKQIVMLLVIKHWSKTPCVKVTLESAKGEEHGN